MAVTPMMQQYLNIKANNKDCLIFFRLGDFYEMFYDDAILVSKGLELTLTGRDCGEGQRAPMCGVPYHADFDAIEDNKEETTGETEETKTPEAEETKAPETEETSAETEKATPEA